MACKFGHLDVVKELIAAGVDINAQTTAGSNTALIYAAYQGHDEVVHELLAAGADAHLPNNGYIDNTALAAAIRSLKALARPSELIPRATRDIAAP